MTADAEIRIKSFTDDAPSNMENPPPRQYFQVQVALSYELVRRMQREVFMRMAERSARSMAMEVQSMMMEFFEQMQERETPDSDGESTGPFRVSE